MEMQDRASTGLKGFDKVIDDLRLGDNVVWQVDSVSDYRSMALSFAGQAIADGRRLVYVRFGDHEPLLENGAKVYRVDASRGFESFATEIHNIVSREGKKAFYVFDCLTDLLKYWYSDLMIGNFFKVTCPYLYELDTVAYFSIIRNAHTNSTIARIRDTTQLLLDLYKVKGRLYIHPLKAWQRYSPTMFFPHLIEGQEAISITASSEVAELFSSIQRGGEQLDYWTVVLERAKDALRLPAEEQGQLKRLLMRMLIGRESRMFELCDRYFTLADITAIASREVGTGFIGGKSVGMLLARKIIEREGKDISKYIEPHDSYYIGSDVFYTYIVENGWWKLRTMQKTKEGYYEYAAELKDKLLRGRFSANIREQFVQMLGHFGQSPIIVRSSSLLEDNFGNAFAGKYESVFCANQGTPEERYEAFENAVRTVYASTMNDDALTYRINRGLFEHDEQMAILVQRVSGDQHNGYFYPHIAGVGNSKNLYVWNKTQNADSGMLRLVFGLGTRAVDRTAGDYARIVRLDDPESLPPMNIEDRTKYSQHGADLLSLKENALTSRSLDEVINDDIKADKSLFASVDYDNQRRLREMGYKDIAAQYVFDFKKLLTETRFPQVMKDILTLLSNIYDYPVDIEFTANFTNAGDFKINLLQCRPLQTRGLGRSVKMPNLADSKDCFFSQKGNFMGGNVRLPIEHVIFVKAKEYLALSEQDKYSVARQIGKLNSALKGSSVMLMGPGRWGTTTPSLGVPLHFSELCNMSVICEMASTEAGLSPELSFGSHFFQDLVEAGIFYVAIFEGQEGVVLNAEKVLGKENVLDELIESRLSHVIHVAKTAMEIYSDVSTQTLVCM
ncbi:MAG: PEP/pyruvate-binding domain-containing protein [Burkholderiales bacterium]